MNTSLVYMEFFGCHPHDRLSLSHVEIECLFLSYEQLYLRFARNATVFRHLLSDECFGL